MDESTDPLLAFCRGDRRQARQLRQALEALGKHSGDREFSDLADRVLRGEGTLRALVRADVFGRVVAPYTERAVAEWRALPEAERQTLVSRANESQQGEDGRDT